jgi:hypothetical protein
MDPGFLWTLRSIVFLGLSMSRMDQRADAISLHHGLNGTIGAFWELFSWGRASLINDLIGT